MKTNILYFVYIYKNKLAFRWGFLITFLSLYCWRSSKLLLADYIGLAD